MNPDATRTTRLGLRRILAALAVAVLVVAGLAFWRSGNGEKATFDERLKAARTALLQKQWDAATSQLEQLLQERPGDPRILHALADAALAADQPDRAIEWLKQVPDDDPNEAVRARFRAVTIALQSARARSMRSLLEEVLRLEPRLAPARRLSGRMEVVMARWQRMRRQVAALDQHDQADVHDVLLFCGGRHLYWEDDEPVEWLKRCLENDPHDAVVRAALIYHLRRRGQSDAARALLEPMNEPAAQSPDGAVVAESWRMDLTRAESALETGRLPVAARLLTQLPHEADAEPRTWLLRGRLFHDLGETEAALVAYRNATVLDPFDPEPVYAQYRLRAAQNDAEAARLLARAEKLQRLVQILQGRFGSSQEQALPPALLLDVAELLIDIGARREAFLCLRSIPPETGLGERTQALVARLRNGPDVRSVRLAVAGVDQLERPSLPMHLASGNEPSPADGGSTGTEPSRQIRLTDVTDEAGLAFVYFHGHSGRKWILESLGGGIGVIDFDADGRPDIYLTQGTTSDGSEPPEPYRNYLFRNLGDGRFVEVAEEARTGDEGYGQGCAVADFDNDGFLDLFVCNYGENVLYRNNGDGTFTDTTESAGFDDAVWSASAAFGDFDRDGDPDLYVANYVRVRFEDLPPGQVGTMRPDAYPAEADSVWENLGDGRFRNVTARSGTDVKPRAGLGVLIADFDFDGWPDIFVGNDMGANLLFANQGTSGESAEVPFTFHEIAPLAGVAFNDQGLPEACMGIAAADVDGNGWWDLFVTNFEDETNTLYLNEGAMQFSDRTRPARLADASRSMLAWGAQWADLEGDGDLDLLLANGHLHDTPLPAQLFVNDGTGKFRETGAQAGSWFETARMGRSVAMLDFNSDGRPDFVVSDQVAKTSLLRNDSPSGSRVVLRLIGTHGSRDAEGTRIDVQAGKRRQVLRYSHGGGYMAANEARLSVGLGEAQRIDRLAIHWAPDRTSEWRDLPAGFEYTFIEGESAPVARRPLPGMR